MHDALGLARRARGVEEEQQVLGLHRLARAALGVPGLVGDQVVEVHVAVGHRDVRAGALDHDDLLDGGRVAVEALVGVDLLVAGLAAAHRLVLGDEDLALEVVAALGHRLAAEPAEDDGVRGAETRARQHRHDGLGDHLHVDPDRDALGDPELLEAVGELDDLLLQLGERDVPRLGGVGPVVGDHVQRDLVALAVLDVPVDAVVAGVELAADEPLGVREVPLQHGVVRGEPVDVRLGLLVPELLETLLLHLGAGVGGLRQFGIRRVLLALTRRRRALLRHPLTLRIDRLRLAGRPRRSAAPGVHRVTRRPRRATLPRSARHGPLSSDRLIPHCGPVPHVTRVPTAVNRPRAVCPTLSP